MEIFDLVAVTIIGISVALSLLRGLTTEIISLVAWFVAFWIAKSSTASVAHIVPFSVTTIEGARVAIAFVVVFLGVWVVTVLLRLMLSRLIKVSGLSGLNRVFGACFGLVRGVALMACVTLVCGLTNLPKKISWQRATLTPHFEWVVVKSAQWLPKTIAQQIHFPQRSKKAMKSFSYLGFIDID